MCSCVKKAPYEIRGLCYAACEEGPACRIRESGYMNKVPCSMPYSRYLSARIEFCNLGIHVIGGARIRGRLFPFRSGEMS